jgi:Rad3-related DNA helicase
LGGGGIFSNRRSTNNDKLVGGGSRGGGGEGAASSSSGGGGRGGVVGRRGEAATIDSRDDEKTTNERKKNDEIASSAKKNRKKEPPRSAPLLDEDGREMFLTLEQADKIVRGILSSSSSSSAPEGQVGALDEGTNDGADVVPIVNRWEDIGITDPNLLRNLRSPDALSCPCPLPVQDRACPAIVSMNDVLVSTHTGSGKTLAFLAPIAQGLLMEGGGGAFPRAMIVAPGRELASQIVSVARSLFAGTGLSVEMAVDTT